MPAKRPKLNTKAVFRIFWEHTKKHPWLFSVAMLGVLVQQGANVLVPVYFGQIFDLISNTTPADVDLGDILVLLYTAAGISITGWVGGRLEMLLGFTLIAKTTADLTKRSFSNLLRHPYQFFTSSFAGALTRRVGRFSDAYESLYYSICTVLLQAGLYIGGISVVLMTKNWVLGAIVLAWVVIFVLMQWILAKWQQPWRLKRAEEDSNLTAALADSISNQNTVALFSGNAYEEKHVGAIADRVRNLTIRVWTGDAIVYGAQGLLSIALNVGMLWVGILYWQQGLLSVGDLVVIQSYVLGVFNYVWTIGRQFRIIYTHTANASEMVEIMETPLGVADKDGAAKLIAFEGEVWFDDVSFKFGDGKDVLHEFNLHIAPGEKVALVGPSGAGKSTVTKLLLRLFDVSSGRILIDNQDIAHVTQESLRNAIAFVPQEPILFHRTLMENIRYGRRDATDAEVLAAAQLAHCHEFIESLPSGYDTYVGERGIKLSGGERQRVAIARALLKNAPILVLDEATSSLDSESEAYIQDALETLMEGKTVITVAHRLSTIMKMDRIVVMDGGTIAAMGTHLELIRERGLYQKLWSIQAGGFLGGEEKTKEIVEEDIAPLADEGEEK